MVENNGGGRRGRGGHGRYGWILPFIETDRGTTISMLDLQAVSDWRVVSRTQEAFRLRKIPRLIFQRKSIWMLSIPGWLPALLRIPICAISLQWSPIWFILGDRHINSIWVLCPKHTTSDKTPTDPIYC